MSENVYSKVLAQLVAKEGSAEVVARLLHVPDKTMQRWMQGHAQMPLRAFMRALDLVVQHEEREAAPLEGKPAPEPLVFRAGPVVAACAKRARVPRLRQRGRARQPDCRAGEGGVPPRGQLCRPGSRTRESRKGAQPITIMQHGPPSIERSFTSERSHGERQKS